LEKKLISVDLRANFGFLKKPDTNEGIYLTYNCLHKPALLGILGAIVGLGGYAQAYSVNRDLLPDYYRSLKSLKVGIQPLDSEKGNYPKTVISYNNSVGYANLDGGTLIVQEQTLLRPSYRIYLLLELSDNLQLQLYHHLSNNESNFIPYLGKNDFQLWWDSFVEYEYEEGYVPKDSYRIETLFIKKEGTTIKESVESTRASIFDFSDPLTPDFFVYFENLPIEFDEKIKHYRQCNFVYTNKKLNKSYILDGLCFLKKEKKIIQLV